jgi:predicted ester cyclase
MKGSAIKGFDAEFRDLDHYIRVITDRIWEGRRIDDIHRYYSDDCAVETPSSVSIGLQPVIDGTRATLAAFPDRRLLAEDIIISGDGDGGFLSSHRILSPMTHAGAGAFGPPSGKGVLVRTIADCVCVNNRIVHEWLVRDQAAIARQIGLNERDLAQRWLNERGRFSKPAMPAAPAPYVSFIDQSELAQTYAALYRRLWTRGDASNLASRWHEGVIAATPGGETQVGVNALAGFWSAVTASFPDAQFEVEHLVANHREGRATSIAMRWRARAVHAGAGRYGAPSGQPVEVLGISHADVEHDRIVREWVLMDDVAIWMQVLKPQAHPV